MLPAFHRHPVFSTPPAVDPLPPPWGRDRERGRSPPGAARKPIPRTEGILPSKGLAPEAGGLTPPRTEGTLPSHPILYPQPTPGRPIRPTVNPLIDRFAPQPQLFSLPPSAEDCRGQDALAPKEKSRISLTPHRGWRGPGYGAGTGRRRRLNGAGGCASFLSAPCTPPPGRVYLSTNFHLRTLQDQDRYLGHSGTPRQKKAPRDRPHF